MPQRAHLTSCTKSCARPSQSLPTFSCALHAPAAQLHTYQVPQLEHQRCIVHKHARDLLCALCVRRRSQSSVQPAVIHAHTCSTCIVCMRQVPELVAHARAAVSLACPDLPPDSWRIEHCNALAGAQLTRCARNCVMHALHRHLLCVRCIRYHCGVESAGRRAVDAPASIASLRAIRACHLTWHNAALPQRFSRGPTRAACEARPSNLTYPQRS